MRSPSFALSFAPKRIPPRMTGKDRMLPPISAADRAVPEDRPPVVPADPLPDSKEAVAAKVRKAMIPAPNAAENTPTRKLKYVPTVPIK